MTTAQLQLPFSPPLWIQRKRSDKLQERLANSRLTVREFRSLGNIEDILPLTKQCAEEHPLGVGEYDELMTRVTLERILRNTDRHYENLFVVYDGDAAVGFLLASVAHSLYADYKVAHEELWFVTPSHRGSLAAVHLLQAFEDWASREGAVLSLTGSNNEWSAESTGRVLRKLGYRQIGVTFVKELSG